LITYSAQLSTKDLTPQVNNMVIKLKLEINKRFGNDLQYELNPLLSEATFLDPRFFLKVKEIIINKG